MLRGVWARMVSMVLLASALAACGGGDSAMRATFHTLSETLPPGAATPGEDDAEPACLEGPACRGPAVRTGRFDPDALPEASGAALSRRDPDVLWLADDRPGVDELLAVHTDGRVLTRLRVEGMSAVNVEALASGPCGADDTGPCLYVGDIGDNVRGRRDVRVLRVAEPDLRASEPGTVKAAVVTLRYPDGAHDAEALLVDGDGVPYIVTKAPFDTVTGVTGPTRLFAAPGFRDGLLLDLGEVPVPEPRNPVVTLLYGNTVTGADAAPGRVLLRTYDQMVEFTAPDGQKDLAGFPSWPVKRVLAPWQPQAEAVAYAADGCGYFSISEGVGDIWLVPCGPAERPPTPTPS